MSLINYDVSISPAQPRIDFKLSMTPSSLTVAFDKMEDYSLSVKPATGTIVGGAIAGAILGAFVGGGLTVAALYAVGAILQSELGSQIHSLVDDNKASLTQKLDFGGPLGYTIHVNDVAVTVSAETVTLGTSDGKLLAELTVKVS